MSTIQIASYHPQQSRRWTPTAQDRQTLEEYFALNPFPDLNCRVRIAKELGIESRQVQIWFQNRRQRERSAGKNAASTCSTTQTSIDHSYSPGTAPESPASPGPTSRATMPRPAIAGFGELLNQQFFQQMAGRTLNTIMPPPDNVPHLSMMPPKAAPPVRSSLPPSPPPAHSGAPAAFQLSDTIYRMLYPRHSSNMSAPMRSADGFTKPHGITKSHGITKPHGVTKPLRPHGSCRLDGLGAGIPMDRRSISLDALDVLSSQFNF